MVPGAGEGFRTGVDHCAPARRGRPGSARCAPASCTRRAAPHRLAHMVTWMLVHVFPWGVRDAGVGRSSGHGDPGSYPPGLARTIRLDWANSSPLFVRPMVTRRCSRRITTAASSVACGPATSPSSSLSQGGRSSGSVVPSDPDGALYSVTYAARATNREHATADSGASAAVWGTHQGWRLRIHRAPGASGRVAGGSGISGQLVRGAPDLRS